MAFTDFCPHKDIKLWQNSSFEIVVYYFFTHVCSVSSVWKVKLLKKDRKSLKTFNYTFLFLHQWHHNFESFLETCSRGRDFEMCWAEWDIFHSSYKHQFLYVSDDK